MSAAIPTNITFQLGRDKYGREITLVRHRNERAVVTWSIKRAPADQRDDSPHIDEIPDDVMRRIVNTIATPKDML